VQEVGKTTAQLASLKKGDYISDIAGPLGIPSEIEYFGTVCGIGGGFGIAALYPIVKELKKIGNKLISIIGARSKNLLIMEEEMKNVSDHLYITTDDGTYGEKGFVSDVLKKLLEKGEKIDRVIAIGPVPMMKVVSEITKSYNIKTIVSLNPIMVDGTGMCGACRVKIGEETKFACVHGPDFDAHLVDFELLMKRLRTYKEEEKISYEKFLENKGDEK
jgi:ferredoxin--NADP+ reductase